MRGWLIYDRAGAERNAWFIEECIRVAKGLGLDLELRVVEPSKRALGVDVDELSGCVLGGALGVEHGGLSEWGIPDTELPDFALVRTIAPWMNARLEGLGVRVFNRYSVARVANDKWESYRFAKGLGLPVMPTELVAGCVEGSPFGYPAVVKSRDGHGGAEVFLVENADEWRALVARVDVARFIVQPLCDEAGKDLRVYVLGGEVLAGVFRVSEKDFRSNYSLGGSVQRIPAPMETVEMVRKLHAELGLDFVGVDFIRHGGRWVFNEMEDSVGCRMLYQTSEIDAVREYVGYVAECVAGRVSELH